MVDMSVMAKMLITYNSLSDSDKAELAAELLNTIEVHGEYDKYKADKFVNNLYDDWKLVLAQRVTNILR